MAFQFKIEIQGIDDPPVWRRVVVPEQFTFFRFHKVIQAAFGWTNSHLFQFSPEGWGSEPVIGLRFEDDEEEVQDCRRIKLLRVFGKPGQGYTYIYDFGDNWVHAIALEAVTSEERKKAGCLEGGGQCPPEDCGGPSGYKDLKRIMADPKDPEYYEMKDWLGLKGRQTWNPAAFDLKRAQAVVQKL